MRRVLVHVLSLVACTSRASGTTTTDAVCENPDFTCTPQPCDDDSDCGPLEPFDENGCLRLPCTTDDECSSEQVCYQPARFGDCDAANILGCEPGMGGCICTNSSAAPDGYCVDEDDRPTKEANECACGCNCGDPGSHSLATDGSCFCEDGYTWCVPEDPQDYSCCPI